MPAWASRAVNAIEVYLGARVRVMHEPGQVTVAFGAAGPDGLFQAVPGPAGWSISDLSPRDSAAQSEHAGEHRAAVEHGPAYEPVPLAKRTRSGW